MSLRYVCGAVAALALSIGAPAVTPAYAQSQELLPPEESGPVTAAGCLTIGGKNGDQYVLTHVVPGPLASVPEATCTAAADVLDIDLDHAQQHGLNQSLIGRWIEVDGTLEKETHITPHNQRELRVKSFRMVPVVPPREAAAAPAPAPQLEQPAAPTSSDTTPTTVEERPVATTGEVPPALPKTASPIPLIGLLGLLSLAGGLALRSRARG
jgi:hypothetical protein